MYLVEIEEITPRGKHCCGGDRNTQEASNRGVQTEANRE
jgi:hypothetical protein